eukprot:1151767-Pelagomonas_calceolata.AAC.8
MAALQPYHKNCNLSSNCPQSMSDQCGRPQTVSFPSGSSLNLPETQAQVPIITIILGVARGEMAFFAWSHILGSCISALELGTCPSKGTLLWHELCCPPPNLHFRSPAAPNRVQSSSRVYPGWSFRSEEATRRRACFTA